MRDTDCDPILSKRHICLLSVIKHSGSLNLAVPLTQLTAYAKVTRSFSCFPVKTKVGEPIITQETSCFL